MVDFSLWFLMTTVKHEVKVIHTRVLLPLSDFTAHCIRQNVSKHLTFLIHKTGIIIAQGCYEDQLN